MHTSRQDVYSIRDMLQMYRSDFEERYRGSSLAFRVVVSDYSWATIHAIFQGKMNFGKMIKNYIYVLFI